MRVHTLGIPLAPTLAAALALTLALAAGDAAAQVQQNNPNAANESLARQSDMRILQQQRVSDFNILNMQAQRSVQYRPAPPGGAVYGYGLRRGSVRHGRVRSGFDPGICVGC
ncbi:hypothetical protein Q8W71_12155 [Methylobacterium sp. NEAU 140]|uniref:hypothetical protein n=1 Tax=Methylobacterium sp. NEAU 140 TaxID=3064945 RepID=UPI002734F62C|nr:hypothetical protein [Methylobacterium sp. NEAU 140]MDP4023382.1 hypothetical protein [Methylobacterium sp. NEAU 140]